jgi:Mrp family chromosome partitioning ATPase
MKVMKAVGGGRYSSPEAEDGMEAQSAWFDYIRLPACKRLVNRILRAQNEKGVKSLAVLSQFPGEGKTVLISVLAVGYMTLLEKKVLILDLVSQTRDESFYFRKVLERPAVPENETRRTGRIDLITSEGLSKAALPPDALGNIDIHPQLRSETPVHPYDAADFQIGPFIKSIRGFYDLILIDTCSLTSASKDNFDPIILAQHVDSTIVVGSPQSMDRDTLASLTRQLKRYQIEPLGIVVDQGAA